MVERELLRWGTPRSAAAGLQFLLLFFTLWKREFIVAIPCSFLLRLLLLESQGFLFFWCQRRHLLLDHNATNRVVVEHKGSVKGNVFLASHSRGTGKGPRVAVAAVAADDFRFKF